MSFARFESSWWADYVHNPGTQQQSSVKADATLSYESSGRWSVALWVKNLSNEPVLAATAAGGSFVKERPSRWRRASTP